MKNRFVARPFNGATMVQGVFDTKSKTFVTNPKTNRPFMFTNQKSLSAALLAANSEDQGVPLPAKRKYTRKATENRPGA